MDPFAKHSIDHISPSSLKCFKENLSVWCGRYLLKVKDEAGPRAWRGTAVEAGLDAVLFGEASYDTALRHTEFSWHQRAQGLVDAEALSEQLTLPSFLTQAIKAFENRGTPLTRQSAIKIELPGVEVPLTGFTDYRFANPDRGYDLKTTYRVPSQADSSHVEQMSAYMRSTGVPFTLVYCSPKKWVAYDVTPAMAASGYERLLDAAYAMRAFLSKVDDARDALSICAPDYGSYWFTDAMRSAVRAAKGAA